MFSPTCSDLTVANCRLHLLHCCFTNNHFYLHLLPVGSSKYCDFFLNVATICILMGFVIDKLKSGLKKLYYLFLLSFLHEDWKKSIGHLSVVLSLCLLWTCQRAPVSETQDTHWALPCRGPHWHHLVYHHLSPGISPSRYITLSLSGYITVWLSHYITIYQI